VEYLNIQKDFYHDIILLLVGVDNIHTDSSLSLLYIFRLYKREIKRSKILPKVISLPLILPLLFLGIRSSVDASTPNQSFYSYSSSTLKNEITNNTIFSLLYSIYLKIKRRCQTTE